MNTRGIITLCLSLCLATAGLASHFDREADLRARSQGFAEAWATHDPNLLASFWAPTGDVINPLGRVARGRFEIAHLFHDEHSTFFRESTFQILSNTIQFMDHDFAFADWDILIHNQRMPDGQLHDNRYHVFLTFRRHNGDWWIQNCRPYQFIQPPPAVEAAPLGPPPPPEAPPVSVPPVKHKHHHHHHHHKKAKHRAEKAAAATVPPAPVTEAPAATASANAPVPPSK
jgi:uncharacterized protein (TIGR02246 family)